MARNFYFGKDANIVTGSANFASLIATGFASYGLSSAQSTAFGVLNSALQGTYSAAINPSTRSPVAIEAKDIAIRNMRASAINLSKIIYSTATVTDAQLVGLGLLPRNIRVNRPVPNVPPLVEIVSVSGRLVKTRLHDTADPERRGKPVGVVGVNIYSFVGDDAPTDPRQYHFEGMTSRMNCEIIFPNTVVSGATVWLCASWVSQRGQVSIGSSPISFTLQGGAVTASA